MDAAGKEDVHRPKQLRELSLELHLRLERVAKLDEELVDGRRLAEHGRIHVEEQVGDSDERRCEGRVTDLSRQERDHRLERLLVAPLQRDAQPVPLHKLLDDRDHHLR